MLVPAELTAYARKYSGILGARLAMLWLKLPERPPDNASPRVVVETPDERDADVVLKAKPDWDKGVPPVYGTAAFNVIEEVEIDVGREVVIVGTERVNAVKVVVASPETLPAASKDVIAK